MPLTAGEKRVLAELQRAINAMRRHYDAIDPAKRYEARMRAGEAYRKLVALQARLLQETMDRDLEFTPAELDAIEAIGERITGAARKQGRVKAALRLVARLMVK